jgi:hypothetical protein
LVEEVVRNDPSAIDLINARAAKQRSTVQLRSSKVTVEARKSLTVSEDTVRYVLRQSDFLVATPLAEVREIGFGSSGSVRRGALYGGVAGGIGLGIMSSASNDGWFTDYQVFVGGFLLGGLGGALAGGILGSIWDSPGVVYRFRPDTPQQMSVVIGVGPGMPGRR